MKADVRCFTCQLDGLVRAMIERDLPRERIEQTTKEYLAYLSTFDMQACAAEVARQSWRWRVRALDDSDSLRAMKREHNRAMLENYDVFYEQVMQQPDPLEAAIKLAAAGNVMDACMDHGMSMRDTVLEALSIQLAQTDVQAFKQVLQRSQRVLLLCDNCGEIVLDKLLLQVLFDLEFDRAGSGERRGARQGRAQRRDHGGRRGRGPMRYGARHR